MSNLVHEIEMNIEDAKEILEIGNALERLIANKDFKTVIIEGLFEKEAIRLVHAKADHNFQTPEKQESIIRQIDAIGALTHYFSNMRHQAMLATKAIQEGEELRDGLLNGDAE